MTEGTCQHLILVGDSLLDLDFDTCRGSRAFVRPGGAALVALTLAKAGHPVTLHTALGDESPSLIVRQLLAEAGIEVAELAIHGTCGVSARRGQRRRRFREDLEICGDTTAELVRSLESSSTILVSDYGGLVSDRIVNNWALLPKGVLSIWDPHHTRRNLPSGISVLTPTRAEAAAVSGVPPGDDEALFAWSRGQGIGTLLITAGAEGVYGHDLYSDQHFVVRGTGITFSDELGAGDVFAGVLACMLAEAGLQNAIREAVKAAGKFLYDGGALALSTPFESLSFGALKSRASSARE